MRKKRKLCVRNLVLFMLCVILTLSGVIYLVTGKIPYLSAASKNDKEEIPFVDTLPADYRKIFKELIKNQKDDRIHNMMIHYEKYPLELLDLLKRNPDTLDFVSSYPKEKDGKAVAKLNNDEIKDFPYLYQWDKRWGYQTYGDDMMGFTGCGPTVVSMVLSHLLKDMSLTPYRIAQEAMEMGLYVEGEGSSWQIFDAIPAQYGINCSYIVVSQRSIKRSLDNGNVVILSMKPGTFTTTGHFILLTGIDEDGKVIVHDPNSRTRSMKHWDMGELAEQSAAGWELYK